MVRRLSFAVLAGVLAASPALAAGGSSGGGTGEPSNRVRAGFSLSIESEIQTIDEGTTSSENPRVIDIPTMVMPAFHEGRLQNYLFVSVQLVAGEGVSAWRLRERTHYMRDAMIRASHRRSVSLPNDPTRIDVELAREIMAEGLADVVSLDQIERIEIVGVDTRNHRPH